MVTVASRMPLIEGVGDEVIFFAGVMVVVACVILAWFSTSVSEQPLIRAAVLVIERRQAQPSRREVVQETENQNLTATIENDNTSSKSSSLLTCSEEKSTHDEKESESKPSSSFRTNQTDSKESAPAEFLSSSIPVVAENRVATSRSESSELNRSSKPKPQLKKANSAPLATTSENRHANDVSPDPVADDASANQDAEEQTVEILTTENVTETLNFSDPNNIRIRLKFLNDSQRLVDGRLEEPLGDFKRRYFHEELENDKVVRLIFNGQLLRSDQETLQFYGLHDNCVVHCQISNSVASPAATQNETYAELDLSRFMLPLFGVILGVIWYCRIQYRQFFNATSTFALLGITGLFFVSLFALFIPRRENRQLPWIS